MANSVIAFWFTEGSAHTCLDYQMKACLEYSEGGEQADLMPLCFSNVI